MGSITLKEIDGSTDRVFNSIEDAVPGQSTFVNLGSGGLKDARRLIFSIKHPPSSSTGRSQLRVRIQVPFVREDGRTEIALLDMTCYQPVSFTQDERKELSMLMKTWVGQASNFQDFVRDMQLPA